MFMFKIYLVEIGRIIVFDIPKTTSQLHLGNVVRMFLIIGTVILFHLSVTTTNTPKVYMSKRSELVRHSMSYLEKTYLNIYYIIYKK